MHVDGNFNPAKFKTKALNEIKLNERADDDSANGGKSSATNGAVFAVSGVQHRTMQAILPVIISQGDETCATYCLYDSGSTGCFVSRRLCDDMDLKSQQTRLKLKTMHGSSVEDSHAIDDLVVTDLNGDNAIPLPRTFSRTEIPVDPNSIPTIDDIKPYPCMKEVVNAFPIPVGLAAQVDVLIGSNCPRALEPLQVASDESCPLIAVRLTHGWTIFGSVGGEPTHSIINHRISHSEILAPDSLMRMFEHEFNECASGPDELGTSVEDRKFLEIVENNISFDDTHYVIPLPLKNSSIEMPNNRSQAHQRLMWQRKKMVRDAGYHKDYVTFVNNLIDKGYCEKAPSLSPKGKTWYLPHHGVYNPNKPGKIRVVYDCGAKFNGISLNDCLLQGPDLMNNLFGVLTRFRCGTVAFVGDLEAMFYQVRVPPLQRSFLRFLWWPEGDLDKEVMEYQMCVHIFGAKSSPSVANFVVRRIGSLANDKLVSESA